MLKTACTAATFSHPACLHRAAAIINAAVPPSLYHYAYSLKRYYRPQDRCLHHMKPRSHEDLVTRNLVHTSSSITVTKLSQIPLPPLLQQQVLPQQELRSQVSAAIRKPILTIIAHHTSNTPLIHHHQLHSSPHSRFSPQLPCTITDCDHPSTSLPPDTTKTATSAPTPNIKLQPQQPPRILQIYDYKEKIHLRAKMYGGR